VSATVGIPMAATRTMWFLSRSSATNHTLDIADELGLLKTCLFEIPHILHLNYIALVYQNLHSGKNNLSNFLRRTIPTLLI